VYATAFWNKLTAAARADAVLLDPVWEHSVKQPQQQKEQPFSSMSGDDPIIMNYDCEHTRKIVLTSSEQEDHRLYRRFRSNFAYFPVASVGVGVGAVEMEMASSAAGDTEDGTDHNKDGICMIDHTDLGKSHNPLVSDIWKSLLVASEGVVTDFNFLTLLRADCGSMFWLTTTERCDGLVIVPRAQFLFVELARVKEGCYDGTFRRQLQIFDVKTAADAVQEYVRYTKREENNGNGDGNGDGDKESNHRHHCEAAARALKTLAQQWPSPYTSTLKMTGMVKILKQCCAASTNSTSTSTSTSTDDCNIIHNSSIRNRLIDLCLETLQRWQDVVELGRLPKNGILNTNKGWTVRQEQSVERAARALSMSAAAAAATTAVAAKATAPAPSQPATTDPGGMFGNNGDNSNGEASSSTAAVTKKAQSQTTSSFDDVVVYGVEPTSAAAKFRDYGLVVLPDIIVQHEDNNDAYNNDEAVAKYKTQAARALEELCREQLEPRGLQVNSETTAFDFAEVRQRPGHRVDNRYHILEPSNSPIAVLGRRLVHELPRLLFPEEFSPEASEQPAWQLLYAGVVHSFPRSQPDNPVPDAQLWHRDGPSVFTNLHHVSHCINVFVPLIDVSTANGTTEFVPGTHDDRLFEQVAGDVVKTAEQDPAEQHKLAVRADVKAGTAVVFDTRVLHRGLANASMQERPVLYFTMAREWFTEQHMFQTESIVQNPRDKAHKKMCCRLFQSVAGRVPDPKITDYGHPHYTTRFDLLLLERMISNNVDDQVAATMNLSAVLAFAALTTGDREALCREFVYALNEDAVERKYKILEKARLIRRETRQLQDFTSIETDMSDVTSLYELTAKILFQETALLSKMGFTANDFGVSTALAMLKAFASSPVLEGVGISAARLEESFTSWWHAGRGRFEFMKGSAESKEERSRRGLLVVFSSLGSGIARPEWSASIRGVGEHPNLDVLHVMDPAFSWYCQDSECEWNGGKYYNSELTRYLADYHAVFYLGDSMGAAAALRFSSLANGVLAFTPQGTWKGQERMLLPVVPFVFSCAASDDSLRAHYMPSFSIHSVDISKYEAITRLDFALTTKKEFQLELLSEVKDSKAAFTIHYGKYCDEDVRQIRLLPQPLPPNVTLVEHDFDDHILSLHLREQGKLTEMIEAAIFDFLDENSLK
jgi:hypothetical protein